MLEKTDFMKWYEFLVASCLGQAYCGNQQPKLPVLLWSSVDVLAIPRTCVSSTSFAFR